MTLDLHGLPSMILQLPYFGQYVSCQFNMLCFSLCYYYFLLLFLNGNMHFIVCPCPPSCIFGLEIKILMVMHIQVFAIFLAQDYVATRWYRAPELCGSFFSKVHEYPFDVYIENYGCATLFMRCCFFFYLSFSILS